MLKFTNKDGKKVMEMTDAGEVIVYDKKLAGLGELKENVKEGEQEDGRSKE